MPLCCNIRTFNVPEILKSPMDEAQGVACRGQSPPIYLQSGQMNGIKAEASRPTLTLSGMPTFMKSVNL